jgi:hypothetical protein
MKLKFKLNLQQFGGGSAGAGDAADGTADNFVSFTFQGVKYDVPNTVYNNIGSQWFNTTDANRIENANAYTAYYIANSGFPADETAFRAWAGQNGFAVSSDIDFNELQNKLGPALKSSVEGGTLRANGVSYTVGGAGTGGLTPPGLTPPGTTPTESTEPGSVDDGQVGAFNAYYNDLYSLAPETGGAKMLGRLEQSYANQAQQAATMADVGFQQAALQQASTVKAITDQVRGERMARLRAGMSESQIANQDMQMLMANVNTLNQNAAMLNDQRLQAQIGMNTAQDQAYMDYLGQANTRGQIATGMAASDAGDAYQQTIRQMTTLYGNDPTRWTGQQWSTVSNQVTGQNQLK